MASCVPSDLTLKMGEMVINNESIMKVDCIARIDIYGFWYYTIFRRYNSPYDIMVEDIHKNVILIDTSSNTLRQIIQYLLNITDIASSYMYISHHCALEYNCTMPDIVQYGLDMSLWDIQKLYSGLYLNIQGVYTDIVNTIASLQIPTPDPVDTFYQAPSDSADIAMNNAEVSKRRKSKKNYITLRSGRKVYKD